MTEPAIAESPHDDSPPASRAGHTLATHYQPFYNLNSGRLQGFEALARMNPVEGVAKTPAEFFAEAEVSGRIREIDAAVLEEALAQTAIWHRDHHRPELILSVNLSAQSVRDRLFVPVIVATVARQNVPGDRLLVDLTTSTFRELLHEGDAAFSGIRALQKREITFCLDGFRAQDVDLLGRAVEVPVDIVKLHPALVGGDAATLTDVARAVQEAGLPVVAAGVETGEHLLRVSGLGFEWAQGFYLGAPSAAADALAHPTTLAAL